MLRIEKDQRAAINQRVVGDKRMEHFTPVSGFIGGAMIGLAASAFVLLHGRIAGISGILGGTLGGSKDDLLWRICFLVGLVVEHL